MKNYKPNLKQAAPEQSVKAVNKSDNTQPTADHNIKKEALGPNTRR